MEAILALALGSLAPPPCSKVCWAQCSWEPALSIQTENPTWVISLFSPAILPLHHHALGQSPHLKGRKVRRSRRTRRTPRILAPPAEATDTTISMMDTKTRKPSRTFQLLRKYACSPKYRPRETTWGGD